MEPATISSPLMSSPAATAPPRFMKCAQHVLVFLFLLACASYFSRSAEGFAMNAIVVVYYTATIHLELLRKKNLDQVIWPLELIAAGITAISMVTAFLVFQPDRCDLCGNVIFSLWAALAIKPICHHIGLDVDDAKYQDASDLV